MAKKRNEARHTAASSRGGGTTPNNGNSTQESNDMNALNSDNNEDNFPGTGEQAGSFGSGGAVGSPFEATQTPSFNSDTSSFGDEADDISAIAGGEGSDSGFDASNPLGLSDEAAFASSDISEDYLEEEGALGVLGDEDGDTFGDSIDDVIVVVEETVVPVPYPIYVKPAPKTLAHRVGQVGGAALAIVKENPVPAALTTLGLFSLVRGVRGGHKPAAVTIGTGNGVYNGNGNGSTGYAARRASRPAPTSLVGGVTGAATDAASSAASSLVDLAKANPVPASAAVLSLFWLVQSQRKGGDGLDKVAQAAGKVADAAGAMGGKVADVAGATKSKAEELLDHTKDTASDLAGTVADKASGAAQSVVGGASGAAHTVAEKATGAAKTVAQGATSAAQTVAGTTTETAGTVARLLAENPLALALTAFAVGIGLGFLLPETDAENRLMGDTADRISDAIADKARQTARDLTGKVEEVATTFSDQVLSNNA